MVIFLVLVAMVAIILLPQLLDAFWSNPFINGMILFVLLVGIILSFRQVIRLFPEVNWVNSLQEGSAGQLRRAPVLLAPVAAIMRDKLGETVITPASMRSILDSVGIRLDEAKDTARYLTGLLVFLGLLGTFYGLLQTVGAVSGVIQNLDVTSGDTTNIFGNLKDGLEAPLGGMSIAFASSLFGQQVRCLGPRTAADVRTARRHDADPEFLPERHTRHGRTGQGHRWARQAHKGRTGRSARPHLRTGRGQQAPYDAHRHPVAGQ
jgi:hypothetical protein